MSRRAVLVVFALVLAACGSSGAHPGAGPTRDASRHGSSCGPAGARTLARDSVARVYQSGSTVYGCSSVSHRRTALGSTTIAIGGRGRIGTVRLGGGYVAFTRSSSGVDTGSTTVNVTRLRDGRLITSQLATKRGFVEAFPHVTALVVRSDGAVAWIGATGPLFHSDWLEVHKVDRAGAQMLDQGGTIDPTSLALHGRRLTWRDGASTRTATLH